jgi:hypothetical protein
MTNQTLWVLGKSAPLWSPGLVCTKTVKEHRPRKQAVSTRCMRRNVRTNQNTGGHGRSRLAMNSEYKGAIISRDRQYRRKASEDQRPIILTTCGGTPAINNSVVPPMRKQCPVTAGKPSGAHISLHRFRKSWRVRVKKPEGDAADLYEKSGKR